MRRAALSLLAVVAALAGPASAQLRFSVTADPERFDGPFTGRVYVMLQRAALEPRFGPPWYAPAPFFAVDVEGWDPARPLLVDDDALAFPAPLSQLPAHEYAVQPVVRVGLDDPAIGTGTGTVFAPSRRLALDGADDRVVPLRATVRVRPVETYDTPRIRWLEHRSAALSAFHGRPIELRAAVILPEGLDAASPRRYPALYWIGGYGADHHEAPRLAGRWGGTGHEDAIVRIVLDGTCGFGHHQFVDSPVNGPWETALVEELIPHLESVLPLRADRDARTLVGHSTGGWASLHLALARPETFGAAWAFAPDPVDFRDFLGVDLEAPDANLFVDADGERRPYCRQDERTWQWLDTFAALDHVWGRGGQLSSWESNYGPAGPGGAPRPLFDRATGAVDPDTARAWRAHDLRRRLEAVWPEHGAELAGRLHVIVGDKDSFGLDGAVRRFRDAADAIGADIDIEIVPGADHWTVVTDERLRRIDESVDRDEH